MVQPASPQFAFVHVEGATGKLKETGDRFLVRSHCMRGKNQKQDSRRAIQKARKRSRGEKAFRHPVTREMTMACSPADGQMAVTAVTLPSPTSPPPDLALVVFGADIDDHSRQLLFKFFTYDIIKYTYPVTSCIDFHFAELEYFGWLFDDEVYLHCTLLTAAAIDDFMQQRLPSRTTCFHLWRTHVLLNNRLINPEAYWMDPIISVVMTLAVINEILGDHTAAHAHLVGLARIIHLRGGIMSLGDKSKLLFKIGRLDLAWALSTGEHSKLLPDPETWDSLYGLLSSYTPGSSDSSNSDEMLESQKFQDLRLDSKLGNTFQDLRQLSSIINYHTERNTKMDGQEFQIAVNSIQSRLLFLQNHVENGEGKCDNAPVEALRLGMLAYLSTTFRVPGKISRPVYLTENLRDRCRSLQPSTLAMRELLVWLLMVGAMSVLDPDEHWLRDKWDSMVGSDSTWEDTKKRLQSVMWISTIHDDLGRRAFFQLANK